MRHKKGIDFLDRDFRNTRLLIATLLVNVVLAMLLKVRELEVKNITNLNFATDNLINPFHIVLPFILCSLLVLMILLLYYIYKGLYCFAKIKNRKILSEASEEADIAYNLFLGCLKIILLQNMIILPLILLYFIYEIIFFIIIAIVAVIFVWVFIKEFKATFAYFIGYKHQIIAASSVILLTLIIFGLDLIIVGQEFDVSGSVNFLDGECPVIEIYASNRPSKIELVIDNNNYLFDGDDMILLGAKKTKKNKNLSNDPLSTKIARQDLKYSNMLNDENYELYFCKELTIEYLPDSYEGKIEMTIYDENKEKVIRSFIKNYIKFKGNEYIFVSNKIDF